MVTKTSETIKPSAAAKVPVPAMPTMDSWQKTVLADLKRIADVIDRVAGQSPQFKVHEFDLATTTRRTLKVDWRPQRWVVWTRTPVASTDTLRMATGVDVPAVSVAVSDDPTGAVEIYGGKLAVMPGREEISFHNPSPNTLHVFAVASGGDDFIIAVP